MISPKDLSITGYTYELPDDKIASHPLAERSSSKLLVYQHGEISDRQFSELPELLSDENLLIFNQSRVIHARLLFTKATGSVIEILCLEPFPAAPPAKALEAIGSSEWKVMIGNLKRWKEPVITLSIETGNGTIQLSAQITGQIGDSWTVRFTYDDRYTFSEIIEHAGKIPLPPYLHREAEASDEVRYQTVYAKEKGSVAAPTAGLHFTEALLDELQQKGVRTSFVSLHVGAGTFKPVKAATMQDHLMHEECIQIDRQTITTLLQHFENKKPNTKTGIVAVGTTAMRTLESLYWLGVKFFKKDKPALSLGQWYPYENTTELTAMESIQQVLQYMDEYELDQLNASTGILIAPGYEFKMVCGLITNFHQPGSTLILLVTAFIGENWRNIYHHALSNNYRFLSYGDSSLLLR